MSYKRSRWPFPYVYVLRLRAPFTIPLRPQSGRSSCISSNLWKPSMNGMTYTPSQPLASVWVIRHTCLDLAIMLSANWKCLLNQCTVYFRFRVLRHTSVFLTQNTYFHLYHSSSCCYFFTVVNCSAKIAKPINSHVHIESNQYQGIARYECNSGYELVGQDVRKCQDNGHWSGTPPQCIGKIF